ncbi:hypothetical protein [Sinomonas sp. P47F7]
MTRKCVAEAVEMRAAGKSLRHIASVFHVGEASVRRARAKHDAETSSTPA